MSLWESRIPDTTVEELQTLLVEADDAKAVTQCFTAVAYKHGDSPAQVEERSTVAEN